MVSRFETAKDEKTARNASFLSAVLMAAMSFFPTLIGLAALAVQDTLPNLSADGSNAMMAVASVHAPEIVVGLISAAIICATMSLGGFQSAVHVHHGDERYLPEIRRS